MADKEPAPRTPAPHINPIFLWPTPERRDLLFYVERDGKLPANKTWAFGDPFWDPLTYPDHKLVYVSPQDAEERSRWYYASDRINEDAYNWEITGDELIRTYLVPRGKYRQNPSTLPVNQQLEDEFLWPPVATADEVFTGYGFADDTVNRTETELDAVYVIVRRRFIVPVQTNVLYDASIERNVTVTKELIGKATATGSTTPGTQIERDYGNFFHDFRITSTVVLGEDEEYPLALTSLIADIPYRFPQLLKGARLEVAWAIADSASAARSYDESWYIHWDLVDPTIGPYEARIRRFLTTDPNALRASYPIKKIVTRRETIGLARAWYYASDKGNSTFAEASQIEIPQAIHDDITIENGESYSIGQSTNFLPATPNFASVVGQTVMIVGYESKQVGYGLYISEITEINCTGVYDGRTIPFGTEGSGTETPPGMGAGTPTTGVERPDAPSASISADNTTISGTTTGSAEVRVTISDGTVVGRAVAANTGDFSLALDVVYDDAVTLTLIAYSSGYSSAPATLTTNDLRPDKPSGSISADMTSVSGKTEPNATIAILENAAAQVESAVIPAYYYQEGTLTFAGTIVADDNAEIEFTSAVVTGSPLTVLVPLTIGMTPAEMADAAKTALEATAAIAEDFTFEVSGDDLVYRVKIPAADDGTLLLDLTDPNGTGVTPATSTDTTAGDPVAITTAGTAVVTVTSGLATFDPVPFWLEVGDDATDIATKAAAALAASPVDDYYVPGSSTNNVSVTADDIAADDPTLAISVVAGTAVGMEASLPSTGTTPGGTVSTVLANSLGNYTFTFSSALTSGDIILVTASDAGGTSDALQIEASATPPTLATAIFADSDTITGTGTVGAKVIAYVGDTDVGDTTVGGGGTFSLNTDYKLIRGESVQVVAVATGNEDVRSASIFLTATDLNLEIPSFEAASIGYVGTTPSGATQIRIRNVLTLAETTATLKTNGTFVFVLPDSPAGTAFDVYARYATGDSDARRVFTPYAVIRDPKIILQLAQKSVNFNPANARGYEYDNLYVYGMNVSLFDWVDGTDMTISFPGSDEADIVVNNIPEFETDYGDGGANGTIVNTGADNIPKYIRFLPLDTSNPADIKPFPITQVTFDFPDGQQKVVTFDRDTDTYPYAWHQGDWFVQKFFFDEATLEAWRDWYGFLDV